MRRGILMVAVGAIACAGWGAASAFDEVKYMALTSGAKECAWCDLAGAALARSKLAGVDLSGADLTDADLSGADLRNVDFSGADLTGANVAGADMSGANLAGADVDQVDLSKAVLTGAKVETAYCDWATKFPAGSGLACAGVTVVRK